MLIWCLLSMLKTCTKLLKLFSFYLKYKYFITLYCTCFTVTSDQCYASLLNIRSFLINFLKRKEHWLNSRVHNVKITFCIVLLFYYTLFLVLIFPKILKLFICQIVNAVSDFWTSIYIYISKSYCSFQETYFSSEHQSLTFTLYRSIFPPQINKWLWMT